MHRIVLVTLALMAGLASAAALTQAASQAAPAAPTPAPWPMFHRDERHTGVITDAAGDILPGTGPLVRWTYRVYTPTEPVTNVRWVATMPLGDLDGDGRLEVIVTTPGGSGAPDRVIALKDTPGQSPLVRPLWIYTSTLPPGETSFDQYSSALVDVDGDGKLDVVFSDNVGVVRALKGTNGSLLWSYPTNHYVESGPMVADLNGDGHKQIIVATDCDKALVTCPGTSDSGALFVLGANPTATLIFSATFPYKMDSAEPVIADIDHSDGTARKAILLGTWGGYLLTVWRDPGGTIYTNTLNIRELVSPTVPMSMPSAIRSSPLVADFGEGPTAVFGWVPNENSPVDAYISAVGLSGNMAAGTVDFTARWSYAVDAWKSSVALLPVTSRPLVVAGYGIAVPPNSQSGIVGGCDPAQVRGGIIALDWQGNVAWHHDYGGAEGNIRGSAAVADLDGDGVLDVVLPIGCYGALKAYNGLSGSLEWVRQLGPRSQASPSLGDLDGDGKLEVVVASYDGNVWVFQGGARLYLPAVVR